MYCPNPECLDFVQDGVHGEYVDTVSVCPKCGARLVAGSPPEEPPERTGGERPGADGREDDPLVEVASFGYRQDADLAVSYLLARDLEAVVMADDAGGEYPAIGLGTGTRLLVPQSRVAEALALLEEADRQGGGA